jgi:hypothetical protein
MATWQGILQMLQVLAQVLAYAVCVLMLWLADIRQAVLRGLADIRQAVLPGLARLADTRQKPFLRKMWLPSSNSLRVTRESREPFLTNIIK